MAVPGSSAWWYWTPSAPTNGGTLSSETARLGFRYPFTSVGADISVIVYPKSAASLSIIALRRSIDGCPVGREGVRSISPTKGDWSRGGLWEMFKMNERI